MTQEFDFDHPVKLLHTCFSDFPLVGWLVEQNISCEGFFFCTTFCTLAILSFASRCLTIDLINSDIARLTRKSPRHQCECFVRGVKACQMGRPYNNTIQYNTMSDGCLTITLQYTALTITLCCLHSTVSVNTFYDGAPYPSAGKRYFSC